MAKSKKLKLDIEPELVAQAAALYESLGDLYGRLPLRSKQPQISCFLPVYGSYDYHKELKSDCRYSAKSRFRWLFTQRWHTTVQVELMEPEPQEDA